MTTALATPADLQAWLAQIEDEERRRAEQRRVELEARCRDSFAAFFREGFHVVEDAPLIWGRHLDAQCETAQAFSEGWLVAHGKGTPAMAESQRAHWRRHVDEVTDEMLLELLVDHLAVNGGPGTLKSRIWMVYLQAWVWLHDPSAAFLCTSGSGKNVTRDSGYAKELVLSPWYRGTFRIPWKVGITASGQVIDSIERWVNSAGGERISIPLLSRAWTGQRGDFLLIDDADDALGVWSEAARVEVRDKHDRAIGNRTKWKAVTLVLQQHVHADDLSSNLKIRGVPDGDREALERAKVCGTWSITHRKRFAAFVLPVEFRPGRRCTTPWGWTDWREKYGEVLFEAQWTSDVIDAEIERLGISGWEAQGNQNPEHVDGGNVERGWIGFCVIDGEQAPFRARPRGCRPRPPPGQQLAPDSPEPAAAEVIKRKPNGKLDLERIVLSVDPKNGSQAATSSNVGLVVMGSKANRWFILDDRTKRVGFLGTIDLIKQIIVDWAPQGLTCVLVEKKVQGPAATESLERDIGDAKLVTKDGKPIVVPFELVEGGSTSFEDRWTGALPAYRSKLVHVLDGASWADDHVDEVCAVPNGAFDDRADAVAQAINHYAGTGTASARFAALAKLKDAAMAAQRRPGMR